MSASSASRLVRSPRTPCSMAKAVQTSYGDGKSAATAGSDAKEGIENHELTTSASRLERSRLNPALHDGESGMNVLWGRREHSDGGGPTPKRASRTMSASSASRLERSPCMMARAVQTSDVDGESTAAAAALRQRRASSPVNAQRARLDLNIRPARWRER